MNAYMVSVVFGAPPDCRIFLTACLVPSREVAACVATYRFLQEIGNFDLQPFGINVEELTPEFMRHALQDGESAKVVPMTAKVVPMNYRPVYIGADGKCCGMWQAHGGPGCINCPFPPTSEVTPEGAA